MVEDVGVESAACDYLANKNPGIRFLKGEDGVGRTGIDVSRYVQLIRHFRTARDPNGNVLSESRNLLGSVSDMIERNELSKLLPQSAANVGELGSVFTNQKRSARPEFIEQRRFSDPRRTDYQDVATSSYR